MADRILLVKLAALGDAVMASTLVPAIRERWPDAELGWVAGRSIAPLVRCLRGVDRVIEVDDGALLGGSRFAAGRAMLAAWRDIGRGWDLALVAHTDARYGLLVRTSGATDVRRFAAERGPRAGQWYGEEYLRLLQDVPEPGWSAPPGVPPLAALELTALPVAQKISGSGALVMVAPGGGRNLLRDDHLRRWPIESWETLVATLVAHGHRVLAVGSAADSEEGARCAKAGAFDLTGSTSLPELAALLRGADAVVTHDSGTLHLAILLDRPTVALFGPTRPEEFIPRGARVTVLSSAAGLPCAPCYNGREYAPCALNRCLGGVSALDVVAAVERILATR